MLVARDLSGKLHAWSGANHGLPGSYGASSTLEGRVRLIKPPIVTTARMVLLSTG